MAYPVYVREKARELRRHRKLTIDQLAERLAVSRTTIYYWVGDISIPRPRNNRGQRLGNKAMQAKYRRLREEAYEQGRLTFGLLARDANFRDFVSLYIAEGFKRNRNVVSVCNSDPAVVVFTNKWLRRLSASKITYSVQYHADQDLDALLVFWATQLGTEPSAIRLQRKSNSSQLRFRTWRCRYGVLNVITHDTLLRARLEAWMDCLKEQWLHSLADGA